MMNDKTSTSISDIPSPIISDIISLLPTVSIMSSKLVCKLWCSLIKHPNFRKSSKSVTVFSLSNRNLHLIEPEIDCSDDQIDGNSCLMLDEKAVTKLNFGDFDGIPFDELETVNSCKGLVCLRRVDRVDGRVCFIVCNPVASDFVVLLSDLKHENLLYLGFGFSVESNEYKLIMVYNTAKKDDDDIGFCEEAYICTLGDDEEWRLPKNRPPQGYVWYGDGVFFKGALHYLALSSKTSSFVLLSFDCQEEIFRIMNLPPVFSSGPFVQLAILDSQLCISVTCPPRYQSEIWVMNEYGVKETWMKLFVVSQGPNAKVGPMPFRPLTYWKSGEVLIESGYRELISYDVASNTWRAVTIHGVTGQAYAMLFDPIFLSTKTLIMQGKKSE